MRTLTIKHVTTYRYRQPVAFGEHRMMLRPRDDEHQKVLESELEIRPEPSGLSWTRDVFGNHVTTARFENRASELRFESTAGGTVSEAITLSGVGNGKGALQVDGTGLTFSGIFTLSGDATVGAGQIHTDLARAFVRAEVVGYGDFYRVGSMKEAKAQGVYRLEGKTYIVKDGDIMHILAGK